MPSYAAVCFDLDDTLCRPERSPDAILQEAFARADCEPYCTAADCRAVVPNLQPTSSDREFYERLFAEAARRADIEPQSAPRVAESYLAVADPTAVRFHDHAKQVLKSIAETIPVALVTNGLRRTQSQKLATLGVTDTFDATVFADPDGGVPPKPDPKPFERALETLDVSASETLHVGDSVPADVAGAARAGLDTAWLPRGDDGEPSTAPTYVLSSLADLSSIV